MQLEIGLLVGEHCDNMTERQVALLESIGTSELVLLVRSAEELH